MTKAIRIHANGGPEVMRWEDVPTPEPGPGEALIRHEAVGLNYIDVYFRTGLYKSALPATIGVILVLMFGILVVRGLMQRFGDKWTHSLAINDLDFDFMGSALSAAGKKGDGAPKAVSAGDGSEAATGRMGAPGARSKPTAKPRRFASTALPIVS